MSPKQQRFVDEYLIDLNATRAYRAAGYKGNDNVCGVEGHKLLSNPKIASAVTAAMMARGERTAMTADRVLLEIARIGTSDLRRVFTADGALKPVSQWDDDTAAAISSVKVVTRKEPGGGDDAPVEYVTELKLWDKNSALDKAGKHLGMFREQIDVNVHDVAAMMAERRKRVAARGGRGNGS